MPTNMLKLKFVFSQLKHVLKNIEQPVEIYDIGCGTGTYAAAFYEIISDAAADAEYQLVDRSPLMLQQAKSIIAALYPGMKAVYNTRLLCGPKKKFRIVLFGNVINEAGVRYFQETVKLLDADMIVAIEPGTKDSFSLMGSVRRFMLKKQYSIIYPCPSDSRCPAEKKEGEWCHQVLRTSLDHNIERLGQLSGLDRKTMPFIAHVYSRSEGVLSGNAQIFRLKKNTKHSFMWQLCVAGKSNRIMNVEVQKRGLDKQTVKQFEQICAGRFIRFTVKKELADGTLRIEAAFP
jgi:hypothetical protein